MTFESTTGSSLETLTITGTVTAPTGTYSVIILVKDNEGNESTQTFTITVKAPAPSSSGSSGGGSYAGGGGQSFPNPQSPKPISPTSQKPTENKNLTYSDEELFNPTINDGKCYFRRPHQGILTSKRVQTTEEFNKALSFLWSYEMTKFDGVDGYDPYRNLSRQEAAKIFSNFAINVLCRQPDKNLTVNYSDILNTDPSLTPYITLAYQLGLMKGSGMGD